MEGNFGKLHEELRAIRQEMKHEIETVKHDVKNLEKSVEEVWATVSFLKEEVKALIDTKNAQEKELEGLRSLLIKTKVELKEEREKISELEDYTRRENLKFHNIPESNLEGDTQSTERVILDILEKELQIDTTDIRFQAVPRIGALNLTNEHLDSEENIVLGGDLNCPLNPLPDKKGGIFTKRKLVTSCIDNFQDHDAISLEFGKLENELKGPYIWKMNCSLLDNEEYVNHVTELIPIWIAEGRKELLDDCTVWDWLKYNIRVFAVHFSQRNAKE
ncbi:uncharacterized protein [Acropora muricata]|uniref:uncharacterized protein n=1 Tax=Acropora muricata TaxID=159855 RepID=UPI0034E4D497